MRASNAAVVAMASCAALFALLYFAAISTYWSISPDSATYVGFAKTLASGTLPDAPPPQPPMTSVLYTPLLALFPDSYLALNAWTRALMFLALAFFYALLVRRSGSARALLVVLLTLASVSFFHASTQQLSEPTYMVFSGAALLLLDRRSSSVGAETPATPHGTHDARRASYLAGVLMVLTVMTRTIGVALPLAVLLTIVLTDRVERDRRSRAVLVAFALLAILAVVLWEVFLMHGSYAAQWLVKMFVAPSPAYTSGPVRTSLWEKIGAHVRLLPAVGGVLLNVRAPQDTSHGMTLRVAAALLFAAGLGLALRRRIGVTEIYVPIYVAAAMLHVLVTGETDQNRFLVPVIPFLFTFALEPVDDVRRRVERGGAARPLALVLVGTLVAYVVCYAGIGMQTAALGAREAHTSPFGDYPIKRPGNYDVERLALWLKAHSQPDERYASAQVAMLDVMTERQGADIVPEQSGPPDAFVGWLDAEHVRYLFVDHMIPGVRDPVFAAIRAHPSRFRLRLELPRASLYEVRPD